MIRFGCDSQERVEELDGADNDNNNQRIVVQRHEECAVEHILQQQQHVQVLLKEVAGHLLISKPVAEVFTWHVFDLDDGVLDVGFGNALNGVNHEDVQHYQSHGQKTNEDDREVVETQ